MEVIGDTVRDDGVACVVAACCTTAKRDILREDINELAFSFVTPLGAQHEGCGHFWHGETKLCCPVDRERIFKPCCFVERPVNPTIIFALLDMRVQLLRLVGGKVRGAHWENLSAEEIGAISDTLGHSPLFSALSPDASTSFRFLWSSIHLLSVVLSEVQENSARTCNIVS
jgi:hypothetical protein